MTSLKPYKTMLYEISRVRKYKSNWFVTRPSSSTPQSVTGSRQEHLPPHIELVHNNRVIMKVNIPTEMPVEPEQIITKPETTRSEKKALVKWFQKQEKEESFDRVMTGWEISILVWNRDNDKYKIKYERDEDQNLIVTGMPAYPKKKKR